MDEFDELNATWGRELLLEYPNGLSEEPNWDADGQSRFIWAVAGYRYHVRTLQALHTYLDIEIGGTKYKDFDLIPPEHRKELAKTTFSLANVHWRRAKQEQERLTAERARQEEVQSEYQQDLRRFERWMNEATTTREIDLKRSELLSERERIASNGQKSQHITNKLLALESTLIERERRARSRERTVYIMTIIGLLVGIIALAATLWSIRDEVRSVPEQTQGRL